MQHVVSTCPPYAAASSALNAAKQGQVKGPMATALLPMQCPHKSMETVLQWVLACSLIRLVTQDTGHHKSQHKQRPSEARCSCCSVYRRHCRHQLVPVGYKTADLQGNLSALMAVLEVIVHLAAGADMNANTEWGCLREHCIDRQHHSPNTCTHQWLLQMMHMHCKRSSTKCNLYNMTQQQKALQQVHKITCGSKAARGVAHAFLSVCQRRFCVLLQVQSMVRL